MASDLINEFAEREKLSKEDVDALRKLHESASRTKAPDYQNLTYVSNGAAEKEKLSKEDADALRKLYESASRTKAIDYPNLTYVSNVAAQIVEITNNKALTDMKNHMYAGYPQLKGNKKNMAIIILAERGGNLRRDFISTLQQKNKKEVNALLNTPTLDMLLLLSHSNGVPTSRKKLDVFTSTSTAASASLSAPERFLRLTTDGDFTNTYNITATSTARRDTQKTGGSNREPKYKGDHCIKYNPYVRLEDWENECNNLYEQLMQVEGEKKFDMIMHWGCIDKNWRMSPLDRPVSSWKYHEHWNMLMTIAMIRHALDKLRKNGTLFLKVRISEKAETLQIVALLGVFFDQVDVLAADNQNLCTFTVLHCQKYNEKPSTMVDFKKLAAYDKVSFITDQWQNFVSRKDYMACKNVLTQLETVREDKSRYECRIDTVFLACLRCISQYFLLEEKLRRHSTLHTQCKALLEGAGMDKPFATYLMRSLNDGVRHMEQKKSAQQTFMDCINSPWCTYNS